MTKVEGFFHFDQSFFKMELLHIAVHSFDGIKVVFTTIVIKIENSNMLYSLYVRTSKS